MTKHCGKTLRALCALALALTLCWGFVPPARADEENGLLRVWLRSLGEIDALGLELAGSYAVEGNPGFRFDRGSKVAVSVKDGGLSLKCGGLTLNVGAKLTLTRHKTEGENGFYIYSADGEGLYTGDLELSVAGGALHAVLVIDVEDYLYGVVPYEMSDSFPLEALKAQAVAARTYALKRRATNERRDYDVADTTQDQVFKGYNAEYQNAVRAVDDTRGIVGVYQGEYASCYYTASNGGQTALPNDIWGGDQDFSYMTMRDDPYDVENPSSVVRSLQLRADTLDLPDALRSVLMARLTEAMASLGMSDEQADIRIDGILGIEPSDPMFADGSRMYQTLRFELRVSGRAVTPVYATPSPDASASPSDTASPSDSPSPAATPVLAPGAPVSTETAAPSLSPSPEPTQEAIGYALGELTQLSQSVTVDVSVYDDIKDGLELSINTSDYELISVNAQTDENGNPASFAIEMRRFGHGVGMSQRGAQWMAGQYGKTYAEILSFYYPGMALTQKEFARAELTDLDALTADTALARPTANPTPAPLRALEDGERYATVNATSLNVRQSPSTGAEVLDVLYKGTRVIVIAETEDGWAQIVTAETSGYVSGEYLTML